MIVSASKKFWPKAVSYTHLRAHETEADLVCRLLLEKKNGFWKYELLPVIVTSETFFFWGDLNKNRLLIIVVLYTLGQNFLLAETITVSRFFTLSAKVYSREIFQNFLSFEMFLLIAKMMTVIFQALQTNSNILLLHRNSDKTFKLRIK